ncbi:LysR family transcriptional regulator [Hyphomonas adhaerens MHS-3]|uniref:LysR family transcriptional regulator n=1 Tax=Hyphomonas adhaerens MHS-3 TaxID=1280949 RepID=A0A069E750_9PROT|nr:LysR family transcriptional regulator [Hyphomonas adhaerens MHS-3]
MDLHATPLRAFLAVADAQSFTRAAEELNMSQPALSAKIKELERRLGFDLLKRSKRHVELSPGGRSFLAHARRMVLETEWMHQKIRDIRKNAVRIGVPYYSSNIPARTGLTDDFIANHGADGIEIIGMSHDRLYRALAFEDIDLALVLEPEEHWFDSAISPAAETDLRGHVIESRELQLSVPESSDLYGKTVIEAADLEGRSVASISRVHGVALSEGVARFLNAHGATQFKLPESNAVSTLRLARRLQVPAICLGWFTEDTETCGQNSRTLPFEEGGIKTHFVIRRRSDSLRPLAETFWTAATRC